MDFYNVLRQPTILPVICSYLRPCERKSLFIGIMYSPSMNEKRKYFDILDELFIDSTWIKYALENKAEFVLYGNNVSSFNRLKRHNLGIGIHLYISILADHYDLSDDDDHSSTISHDDDKMRELTMFHGLHKDVCVSNDITSYEDVYKCPSFLLSFTFGHYLPGVREHAPLEFNTRIFNELDERPKIFDKAVVLCREGIRYYETDYISIKKDSISSGKLHLITSNKYPCRQCGTRRITIINAVDDNGSYVSFPDMWETTDEECCACSCVGFELSYTR